MMANTFLPQVWNCVREELRTCNNDGFAVDPLPVCKQLLVSEARHDSSERVEPGQIRWSRRSLCNRLRHTVSKEAAIQ